MERMIQEGIRNPERAAGIFLVAAFLIPLLMLLVLAIRGNIADVFAQIGGAGRDAFVRNLSLSGWMIAALFSLAGFNLISTQLGSNGERLISGLALTAMLVATILLLIEGSIHLAFGAWASDEVLQTGTEPALYSVIFEWASVILQRVYLPIGYISLILFGGSMLTTAWLPAWCGWVAIGWGGGMIGLLLLTGTTLPATLLIPGTVIGMFLLTNT